VPVLVPGARPGALELTESLQDERDYTRHTIVRIILQTAGIMGVCGLLTIVLGMVWVGRPVQSLVEQARKVGTGDFTGRLQLRNAQELSELGGELNQMCERLTEAQARIAQETAARISTLDQLRHADRLMTVGKLASGVAHELGTPLNVVMVLAKMISSGEVTGEETGSNARTIAEQAERMTGIIRQLLDFARPRAPCKVRTDLSRLVSETLGLLKAMAGKRGVSLELEDSSAPIEAEIDADQIQQVLLNLLQNGLQAMPEGGRLSTRISRGRAKPPPDAGGREGEYHRLDVRDQGVGILPENVPHLFDPFFSTKEVGEGTGLGLSVSLGIVREHGGWIAVESRVGGGSCFSVYLP
jgi:signal transduction histidine kinase